MDETKGDKIRLTVIVTGLDKNWPNCTLRHQQDFFARIYDEDDIEIRAFPISGN